jgi:hypothetical protein
MMHHATTTLTLAVDGHEARQRTPTSLALLAPDDWFDNREGSAFLVRIVSPIGMRPADLEASLDLKNLRLAVGGRFALAFGHIDGFEMPRFHMQMYADEDGKTTIYTHLDKVSLKKSHAFFLAAPLRRDGVTTHEGEARAILDRATALLQLHLGRNLLRDIVFEGTVDAKTGAIGVASRGIRTPDAADGPILARPLWDALRELHAPLEALPVERRSRIDRSLEFIARASRDEEEFFNLWTALELIANGRANSIRARIVRALGLKHIRGVDTVTGFAQLARWRHDFIHHGLRPFLTTHAVRYMEWLYVDLLRDELGLPPMKFTLQIQVAEGYDLSSIGLRDNRAAKPG